MPIFTTPLQIHPTVHRTLQPRQAIFLLGQPITLTPAMCNDRAEAEATYAQIKLAVRLGMDWLLRKREYDPYK